MNKDFTTIIKKLISEQGKKALSDPVKCKAFLADYTHGEYRKESRLLLQALEAGIQKAIETADDLEICKKQQIRVLREEHFLAEEVAADIVDMLILVLKGQEFESGKQRPSQTVVNTFHQNIQPVLTNKKRQRHILTTSWLILGLIISGLQLLSMLLSISVFNFFYLYKTTYLVEFSIYFTGFILLLCWKKIGFKLMVVIYVFFVFIDFIFGFIPSFIFIFDRLSIFLIVILTWVLLKLRKNGKSTWEQLE